MREGKNSSGIQIRLSWRTRRGEGRRIRRGRGGHDLLLYFYIYGLVVTHRLFSAPGATPKSFTFCRTSSWSGTFASASQFSGKSLHRPAIPRPLSVPPALAPFRPFIPHHPKVRFIYAPKFNSLDRAVPPNTPNWEEVGKHSDPTLLGHRPRFVPQ